MKAGLRVLLCLVRPPFRHAWMLLERLDEPCEAPAIGETWWLNSDAATWGRYTHF